MEFEEGNIVDVTFMRANSKPHINPNKNSDVDASLGHKGFGYRGLERVTAKFESLIIAYNFYRLGVLLRTREICV